MFLTHWGRVTHICVGNLTTISSDNGLSPGRHQAIIWTNAGVLLIGPLATNFSEILIEILTFLFTKMRLNVSCAKWRPCCLDLNVLKVKFYCVDVITEERSVSISFSNLNFANSDKITFLVIGYFSEKIWYMFQCVSWSWYLDMTPKQVVMAYEYIYSL